MKKILLPFLMLGTLILSGCSILQPTTPDNKDDDSGETDGGDDSGKEDKKEEFKVTNPNLSPVIRQNIDEVTYLDLFNLNNKISISIDVDREEMEKIAEDNNNGPKPEVYRLAKRVTISMINGSNTFSWELEDVGIRQKGNTSRESIFIGDTINNHNHFKLSFDETFSDVEVYGQSFVDLHGNTSDERKDRTLLGLTGLDFKWDKNDDTTHVKELYVNEFYRHAGIITQHIGLSTVQMHYDEDKTADFGLCYIYEPASKTLIKRALESDVSYIGMDSWKKEKAGKYGVADKKYGDFYKASYGRGNGSSSGASLLTDSISGNKVGIKTDIWGNDYPTYERKTNVSDNYDDKRLKDAVKLLNKSGTTVDQIGEVVDLRYFAMEEAVSYIVGNPDSFRNNYNNYMIYIRRTDGKMVFIPIDNDRALGIGKDWTDGLNFVLERMKTPTYSDRVFGSQQNPLFNKTILAKSNNQVKTDYLACLELLNKSAWVKEETFNDYFDLASTTYSGLATFSLEGGQDNITFKEAINKQKEEKPVPQKLFPDNVSLYVVGSFDAWGEHADSTDPDLYFVKRPDWHTDDYVVHFEVTENTNSDPNIVKFKISDTPYGIGNVEVGKLDETTAQNKADCSSFSIAANIGDIIEFKVNASTGLYSVKIADIFEDFEEADLLGLGDGHNVEMTFNGVDEFISADPISTQNSSFQLLFMDNRNYMFYKIEIENNHMFLAFGGSYVHSLQTFDYTVPVYVHISITTHEVTFVAE